MHHPFRHQALPYAGSGQFVASSVTALRDALDRDERPLLLAEPARLDDVRDGLGPDVDSVALVPTNEHGRNPSRLLTLMHSFVLDSDGRRTLALVEPSLATHDEAARAEVLLTENVFNATALREWSLSVMCLYDTKALDEHTLLEMRRSHPVVRGEDDNDDYEPDRLHDLYSSPLPPPPPDARTLQIDAPNLARMRAAVHEQVLGYGVAPDRVDDLVLAVNEIVTNSIRHGGGRCTLRVWATGRSAVCEVADGGWLRDPLIGRLAPDPARSNGRGLWLAHHLCDLVQIRSSSAGTVVRLFVDC